jgi:signal transduction histidine kinase
MPTTVSRSSNDSLPEGLALVCAGGGTLLRTVVATIDGAPVTESLRASVDPSSDEACLLFLRSIGRGGFARSTPLRIGTRDVQCFGWADGEELLIAGVIDPATAAPFAELVAETAGEERFQKLAEEIRRTHSTYELYEELAHVNNELVTAQRELARTVAELQRLNAYKDELLGIAAHDLRNPLSANAAFITFLMEDSAGFSADNLVLLKRLHSNSRFMLQLVESVLDFSAIQAGQVRLTAERTNLGDLLQGVVETMRIISEPKRIEIRYDAAPDLPLLQVDRVKMTQSVQNLISNAVQYSAAGTVVEVRLSRSHDFVDIEVEDHGPGIPPGELPSLFKPFTRLSTVTLSESRSVGLGLAITRRLVEAHGGTIDVRSEVGKGSVFAIRLKI